MLAVGACFSAPDPEPSVSVGDAWDLAARPMDATPVPAVPELDPPPPPADPAQIGLVFAEANAILAGAAVDADDGHGWFRWVPRVGVNRFAIRGLLFDRPAVWAEDRWRYRDPVIQPPLPVGADFPAAGRVIAGFQWGARHPDGSRSWPLRMVGTGDGYLRPVHADGYLGTSLRLLSEGAGTPAEVPARIRELVVSVCGADLRWQSLVETPSAAALVTLVARDRDGAALVIDYRAEIIVRASATPAAIGIGPSIASMFWRGAADALRDGGSQAHDGDHWWVDGSWEPLANPGLGSETATTAAMPARWGLLQVERGADRYAAYPAEYHRRPSLVIEGLTARRRSGEAIPLILRRVVQGADGEYFENVFTVAGMAVDPGSSRRRGQDEIVVTARIVVGALAEEILPPAAVQ